MGYIAGRLDEREDERMTAPKNPPDWERIEADYRAGLLPLRTIAENDGNVTEAGIRKRATRDEWVRDLGAKIKAKAEDLVRKAEVRNAVRKNSPTERELVDAAAMGAAGTVIKHKKYAGILIDQVETLVQEVKESTGAEALADRVDMTKKLADALHKAVAIEREAYGLEAPATKSEVTIKGKAVELGEDALVAIAAGQA